MTNSPRTDRVSERRRVRYDEGCLAAHALNVIGDRWALLVVRELLLGPKRFQTLRSGLPGITAAVLTTRLRDLAGHGIVERNAQLRYYALTPLGQGLRPVVLELARWGVQHPDHDPSRFISPTSLMLSMSIMVDPAAAAGRPDIAGFDLGEEQFTMRVDDAGAVKVTPSLSDEATFVLAGTGNTLAAAVYGPRDLRELVDAGAITVTGNAEAAQSFVALFALRGRPAS